VSDKDDLGARHDELIRRLRLLGDVPDEDQRALARAWIGTVERARRSAEAPLSVAFLAAVGCGKSSMIAALAGLRIDEPNDDPSQWSVLPVGDGRTTLGELRVEFDARDDLELEIQPMTRAELELEIRLFARDRFEASGGRRREHHGGEELNELLRAWLAPGVEDAWAVLDDQARAAETVEALEAAWLGRIDLAARSQPLVRRFAMDDASLRVARDELRSVFAGTHVEAPVPRRTIVRVPARPDLDVAALIDLQGIDDGAISLAARSDVARLVRQPDVLWLVGSDYKNAPDPVSRQALAYLTEALATESVGRRVTGVVIVDNRGGELSSEASRRQRITKVRQCREQLERNDIRIRVESFDVRREVEVLRQYIQGQVDESRKLRTDAWQWTLRVVGTNADSLRDVEMAAQRRAFELALWWVWDAAMAKTRPVDGLEGVARAIERRNFHWTQLHAAVRRKGRYDKLDLIDTGSLLAALLSTMPNRFAEFETDVKRQFGADGDLPQHLNIILKSFVTTVTDLSVDATSAWESQLAHYLNSPAAQPLWDACVARWGQGGGYVDDVARLMREASKSAKLTISVPSLEARLPPRPPLFSLRKVRLINFRGIVDRTISPTAGITAIIGDNGLGKTAWLEATAAAIGAFLPGVGAGPAPRFDDGDVRIVSSMLGGILDSQPQLPMAIEVEGHIEGRSLAWSRRVERLPVAEESTDGALAILAAEAGVDIRAQSVRQLPVLAYYGTDRLWASDDEPNEGMGKNRLDGYRDCLRAAWSHKHLLGWVRKYTFAELQDKQPNAQLRAIERAVVSCVDGAAAFRYQVDAEQLVLVMQDGQVKSFATLSDGYRNVVAMVANIAWRACALNPHLRERAPALAEGVVLIDEIDLHLHPKWQRRVLGDLQRAFPRLQFIVTTHSPFIVQSLADGQLVNLDLDVPGGAYANESPEDIVERQMGVELPQRSERRRREYEAAKRYYDLLDRMPGADPDELARIKAELDEIIAPYADNQAYVAFLERKRLRQESVHK
jgi:predicted ATP-binding protein involved in virulence